MSVALENLRRDIRMRLETDSVMSSAWLLIYLLPVISIVLMPFSLIAPGLILFIFPFAILISILSFIVSIVLTYKLVKRRNEHFKRQAFLYEDVLSSLKEIVSIKGASADVEVSSLERGIRESKMEETEKNAVLWAILSAIIFIASWYVYYFLMKDFYKHERREDAFYEDVGRTLGKCGITFTPPRRISLIPDRSFILYLVLTIITVGIFGIYWIYVLLKDPNEHFKHHIGLEEDLLKTLELGIS